MRSTSLVVMSCAGMIATAGMATAQVAQTAPSFDQKTATSSQDFQTQNERAGLIANFDLSGIESVDGQGAFGNTVVTFDVADALGLPSGTALTMNGIGWKDVTLTTFGASWLSEAVISFAGAGQQPGLFLTVGAGDDMPGTMTYDSGGVLKFADVMPDPIPDIQLPDGTVTMEFFESFDDVAGEADAVFESGSLNIQVVPAPGAAAVLGLGGLAAARRRRR